MLSSWYSPGPVPPLHAWEHKRAGTHAGRGWMLTWPTPNRRGIFRYTEGNPQAPTHRRHLHRGMSTVLDPRTSLSLVLLDRVPTRGHLLSASAEHVGSLGYSVKDTCPPDCGIRRRKNAGCRNWLALDAWALRSAAALSGSCIIHIIRSFLICLDIVIGAGRF